jgi:WD40 repeat protein
VLLAVRADFYGRCAEYPALGAMLGANQVLVGAMRRDELRRAIEMPAQRAGLQVEPELVDALLADTADEPGALPMLSTALLELWQQRDGNRLRLATYERTGGVRGAVARMAERAYGRLDPADQRAARRILLRLTGDVGVGAHVRRRVPLAELEGEAVLEALADSRLLTVSEGSVEVAHEALLREWPRLKGWLDEDAAGRRVHTHLIQAAREWSEDRDHGELYRGARLASALEWRAEHEPELNTTERQFLDASRLASERARRRIQLALAGVTALLIVAVAAGMVALGQRGRARDEARAAEAQRLGAQALNTDAVDLSLLLARQGVALDDDRATQLNLLAALRRSPAVIGAMRPGISGLFSIEQPAGGDVLAVSDLDSSVAFLDPTTRRRLAVYRSSAGASGGPLLTAPDGSHVATVGVDFQGGFIDVFDPRTRERTTELREGLFDATPETALFSPDSKVLLVQGISGLENTNRLWRWDVRGAGRPLGDVPMPGDRSRLLAFVRSRLVTYSAGDHVAVVRDPASLRAERRFPLPSGFTAFASSRRAVAFAMPDGSIRLLAPDSGRIRTADGRHDGPITALAFSPDGRTLVTAGLDNRLIVWDTGSAKVLETLQTGAAGVIEDLAVTQGARTAYSAGRDGAVLIWDLEGSRRFERPLRLPGREPLAGRQLVVSGSGRSFAAVDRDGTIATFDGHSLRPEARIRLGGGARALAAALSPDGRTLAVTDRRGRLQFWDVRTREPLGEPVYAHAYEAQAVRFSADGRWLVTGGFDPILRLWDARTRRLANSLDIAGAADLSLNPRGTLLAVTLSEQNFAGGLEIRSVPDLGIVRRVPAPRGTVGRFTPNGRWLVYGDREGRVWTYDTRTWKPRGRPLDIGSPVLTADVSPDGRTLATSSVDGRVGLWDLAVGRAIGGDPLRGSGDLVGAGFIDGGRQLVVLHETGGFAWDLRPASWEQHACSVAGRTLTRAEWADALGNLPYAPACAADGHR